MLKRCNLSRISFFISAGSLLFIFNCYAQDDVRYLNQGIVSAKNGNFEQAITDYSKAISLNPNYIDAYIGRGRAYSRKENIKQAISDYNRAILLNPNYAEGYKYRGYAYLYIGKYSQRNTYNSRCTCSQTVNTIGNIGPV